MHINFTKMQGAGNDFVVLDETRGRLNLTAAQYRFLADRHFGVGADQILSVRAAQNDSADFEYAIHNADGGEVEHCGNGARCFVRYVRERGLTDKTTIRVKTINSTLILTEQPDGRVTVDMGAPVFDLPATVFDTAQAYSKIQNAWEIWHIPDVDINKYAIDSIVMNTSLGSTATTYACDVAVLSMGNPHAVQVVPDVDTAGVLTVGPWLESHPAFARRVNAGFMQIVSRQRIRLRVYERGAGETLACGTGACAAVVAGIRLGLLDERVDVHSRGGVLTVQWAGLSEHLNAHVLMTGPATTVFMGSIEVPDNLV